MAAKVTLDGEFANSLLKLLFNATPWPNMADDALTSPFTNLYVSLHTASPTASGDQESNEATYGSYARVAVARTTGGWTITDNEVSPVASIVFPAAVSGSETATFFGIGTSSSGPGHLLYFGAISPVIPITAGVIPDLTTGSIIDEV